MKVISLKEALDRGNFELAAHMVIFGMVMVQKSDTEAQTAEAQQAKEALAWQE